jgi:hypothetical protein
MFQLYRAIIRPYLKNISISLFNTFGIPVVYIDGIVITYAMLFFISSLKTSINPFRSYIGPPPTV